MKQFNCSAVAERGMQTVGMLKVAQALLPSKCHTHWVQQDGRYACTSMCTSTTAESARNALFR